MKENKKKYQSFALIFIFIMISLLSACDGVPPGADSPIISSFTASSTSITSGESVTLSWSTTNASSASIDNGIGSVAVPSGSVTVSPITTTTYILTASNSSGSSTDTVTITVNSLPGSPVIHFFTADKTSIHKGESVTLSWQTTDADEVYLEHSSLSDAGSKAVALTGSESVSPDETTTYYLTAVNSIGSNINTITVTVTILGPVYNENTGVYYETIQAAIDDAEEDSYWGVAMIRVSPGIYNENLVFRKTFPIFLWPDISPFDPADFIIDGRGIDSAVKVTHGGDARIEGFTVRNGRADIGGGIYAENGTVILIDCVVCDNEAVNSGGGIYVKNSELSIQSSVISDNAANHLGGGICMENSRGKIQSTLISGNLATSGGGISICSVRPYFKVSITYNTIRDNRANSSGGGISINGALVDISSVGIGFNVICGNRPVQATPDKFFSAPSNKIYNVCPWFL